MAFGKGDALSKNTKATLSYLDNQDEAQLVFLFKRITFFFTKLYSLSDLILEVKEKKSYRMPVR